MDHIQESVLLCLAVALAAEGHHGQTDKAKVPYLLHPLRVMLGCYKHGLHVAMAAVLHDVVEDTHITLARLQDEGMPSEVVEAVDALSRREGEHYLDEYITRVKRNRIARLVKLTDLDDNYLNPDRLMNLRLELRVRYEKAFQLLLESV